MAKIRARHDAVLREVAGAVAAAQPDATIRIDATCPEVFPPHVSLLRPDLQVITPSGILLVDVKCPFETTGALAAADQRNTAHYEDLARELAKATGKRVQIRSFVIGALGTFWPPNWTTLFHLGLKKTAASILARQCVRAAIHGSRNIWVLHTTGRDHV